MSANHFVAAHFGKRHFVGAHFPPAGGVVEEVEANSGGWSVHPYLRPVEIYSDEIEASVQEPLVIEFPERKVSIKPGARPSVAEAFKYSHLRVKRIELAHPDITAKEAAEAVWNILHAERDILTRRARLLRDDNELIVILYAAGEM